MKKNTGLEFIKKSVFFNTRKLELEDRVSITLIFTGMILSILALVLGIVFETSFIMNLPHMIVLLICIVLPLIFKSNLKVASFAVVYFVSFIYFPFIYFTNGGINGTGPFYFIMIIVYFAFYRRGLKLLLNLGGLVIYYIGVIILSFSVPQIVTPYPDLITQYIDMGISFISVAIVLSIISGITYESFFREHKNTLSLTKDLEVRNRELEELSITDQMTGVYSKQFFIEKLQRETDLSVNDGESFYVMMIDIDFFKKINDTFGHLYGDEILKLVAKTINANLRNHDITARYGGEEFITLVTRTGNKDGSEIGERIRAGIEQMTYRDKKRVTVSIGIAEYRQGETVSEIIHRADKHLYSVKANGRNGVSIDTSRD